MSVCMPVQADYDKETHDITHEPFIPLCDACVRARTPAKPVRDHKKNEIKYPPKERKVPQNDFDFCMLTEPNDYNVSMMLVGVVRWKPDDDNEIPYTFAIPCPSKRASPWLIKQILNELEWIDGIQKET